MYNIYVYIYIIYQIYVLYILYKLDTEQMMKLE